MDCLNSTEPDVILTASKFLPEFIVLCNGKYGKSHQRFNLSRLPAVYRCLLNLRASSRVWVSPFGTATHYINRGCFWRKCFESP